MDWLKQYTFDSLIPSSPDEQNTEQNKSRTMELDTNSKDQFYLMRQKMKKLTRQSEEQTDIMKKILSILNDDDASSSSIATKRHTSTCSVSSPAATDSAFFIPGARLSGGISRRQRAVTNSSEV